MTDCPDCQNFGCWCRDVEPDDTQEFEAVIDDVDAD